MRTGFRYLTSVLFAAVVVQVALAAFGAFDAIHKSKHGPIVHKTIDDAFGAHAVLGYVIVIVMVVLLVLAAVGRCGPTMVRLTGGLLLAGVIQAILGSVSQNAPIVGVLHGINALAIYALSGILAHRTWTANRAPRAAPAASPAN